MKTLINILAIMAAFNMNLSAQTKYTGGSSDGYSSGTASHTGGGGALPIKLLSFKAELEGNEVALDWKTAAESSNDFFTVERKNTNGHWELVGTKTSLGNKIGMVCYNLIDTKLPENAGQLTYRLLQTDLDGKSTEVALAIISLTKHIQTASINIFPNPANGYVNVVLGCSETIQIKLTSMDGKEVLSESSYPGDGITRLDLSEIKAGLYILSSAGGEIKTTQLIIQ